MDDDKSTVKWTPKGHCDKLNKKKIDLSQLNVAFDIKYIYLIISSLLCLNERKTQRTNWQCECLNLSCMSYVCMSYFFWL